MHTFKENKKIILVGYMGSGKTTIGQKVAESLQVPFIDLDVYIEKKELNSINDIFSKKGEIYFRKKEHEYFRELLLSNQSFVLSLGGGTPCYANNHLELQNIDVKSFYLKANVKTLVKRLELEKQNRPLISSIDDLYQYIGPHLLERSHYYHFAQHVISVENKSIPSITEEIMSLT